MFALAGAHDRREYLESRALGQRGYLIDHLIDGLLIDLAAALGAVRGAYARVEQAQVVMDLGNGAHGRAGIAAGGLLVYRYSGRQAVDIVDVRLFHLAQELARIRRQRLHIAPLALGVYRVKRQRRLARAAQARKYYQLVARYLYVNVFQVVGARALYDYRLTHNYSPQIVRSGPLLLRRGSGRGAAHPGRASLKASTGLRRPPGAVAYELLRCERRKSVALA